MDVWVISNPGPNAVGCPHPRPNPAEGRVDLQLGGYDFAVFMSEEMNLWRLSAGFVRLEAEGLISLTKTTLDAIPKRKADLPSELRPDNAYDRQVAYQVALAPDKTDDMQLARINLFRSDEAGKEWAPEADKTYLKTRHWQMLKAAEWYLTVYITKRTQSQNHRLRDVRRQLKIIEALV